MASHNSETGGNPSSKALICFASTPALMSSRKVLSHMCAWHVTTARHLMGGVLATALMSSATDGRLGLEYFLRESKTINPDWVACVLVGWSFGLTIVVVGIVGLNLIIRSTRWLLPDGEILADALGLSIAACVLAAGVSLQVLSKAKASSARMIMKLAIVLVTVLSIYGCNRWQTEGSFLLTTRVITGSQGFAGGGMFVLGAGLLALSSPPKR